MSDDGPRLVEGSEIRVTYARCGKHMVMLTVMIGTQRVGCPETGYTASYKFSKTRDGHIQLHS